MALPLASDNPFPSVLFDEQASDVSTPATGFWRAFFKSDGLYVIDDAGTVVGPLAAAAGASNLVSAKVTRTNVGSNLTTSSATYADMDSSNLTITMTTGARRVLLTLSMSVTAAATITMGLGFSVDGTAVTSEAGASKALATYTVGTGLVGVSLVHVTDALSAGSHTFRPRWAQRAAGGTVLTAHQTAATDTIVFSAVELYTA